MFNRAFREFINLLSEDQGLQQAIADAADLVGATEILVKQAAKRGFHFAQDDVSNVISEMITAPAITDELSEEELLAVAGGVGTLCHTTPNEGVNCTHMLY